MSALRLFFALWPSDEEARATHELAGRALSGVDGRPIPVERLHLTLWFLGNTAPESVGAVQAAARRVAGPDFELTLDETGCWRRKGIAWLAPSEPPPALEAIRRSLGVGLEAAGVALEARGWRPHVTLARKVSASVRAGAGEGVRWRIRDFVLVRSVTHSGGPDYTILDRFSLGVRAPPV